MSEIKLKPCPFCKSENISEGSRIFDFGEDIHIMCRECGAKIQICKEYGWDELRKRWNRRAVSSATFRSGLMIWLIWKAGW